MDTFLAIKFAGALFAIMNPVSNLPVFLSVTDGMTEGQRRTVAFKTSFYCLIAGSIVALAGQPLLNFFGISADNFRVAGGLVVLLIGLGMLSGQEGSAHHGTEKEKAALAEASEVAFYPLTFPILVGPGTIMTLILYRQEVNGAQDLTLYWVVFVSLVALICAVFMIAGKLGTYISITGRMIMTRLMGMILSAIAMGMITEGLLNIFPGLAG